MHVDLRPTKLVYSKVPQTATKDGGVKRKLFPPFPHEVPCLPSNDEPSTLDPKLPSGIPKPSVVSRSLRPHPPHVTGSKGPRKIDESDKIVKKFLTLKKALRKWKHRAIIIPMQKSPPPTVGTKRALDRQEEEEVNSLKKSCLTLGDALKTPLVSATCGLRGRMLKVIHQQRLLGSPTGHYENFMLEHSGAWEPPGCSCPT